MNKEELLQALACFGCEDREDCESIIFEHGKEWCEEKYKKAIRFVKRIGLSN